MHGEHENGKTYVEKKPGSPPHTRGTRRFFASQAGMCGITPAYTGNTFSLLLSIHAPEDHPRIHGEHNKAQATKNNRLGSPPHTRGTLGWLIRCGRITRITPAYTGNTSLYVVLIGRKRDHPRIHGEHLNERLSLKAILGSPPHTRGTLNSLIIS